MPDFRASNVTWTQNILTYWVSKKLSKILWWYQNDLGGSVKSLPAKEWVTWGSKDKNYTRLKLIKLFHLWVYNDILKILKTKGPNWLSWKQVKERKNWAFIFLFPQEQFYYVTK